MISGSQLDRLQKTGKHPCAVCLSGTGSNSIYCGKCDCWVHKKCSGIKGPLRNDPNYTCPRCTGAARPVDGRPVKEVEVGEHKLEVVAEFCYLGDMLSSGGDCELASTVRCRSAWGKFRELLPILTNKHIPLSSRGRVYSTCVRSVMLHGSETWAASSKTLNRLRRNDRAMIRWICRVRPQDDISSDCLLEKLGIEDIVAVLQGSRMRWLGHVERSNGWIAKVRKHNIRKQKAPGRPKLTWDELVRRDRVSLGMEETNPEDRNEWRGRLRSRLGSQAAPSVED
jgi:hypothetical protein